jgi:hypothetical protein
MIARRAFFACLALLTLSLSPASAANLAAPKGRVLLTVTGAIETANQGEAAVFDGDMLAALDWREIETYTYYTEGVQRFSGPTLASLLAALGVSGGVLRAVALDDYTVEIPVSDLEDYDILLALQHNGKPMRVRDRGPIWIIYPAASPEEIEKRHIAHSIWQLNSLDVLR